MRSLVLSLAVLLCVSVSLATPSVYDFEGIPDVNAGQVLNGQVDNTEGITWKTSYLGNSNILVVGAVGADTNGELADPNKSQERLCTTITNQGQGGPSSLFNLDPDLSCPITLSYDCYMDNQSPWLVGIWIDGTDPCAYKNGKVITSPGMGYKDNVMPNNETEIAVQFGGRTGTSTTTPYNRGWRVRGANGSPDTYGGTNQPYPGADPNLWRLTLVINLDTPDGNGIADLWVENLDVGGGATKVIDDAKLGFAQFNAYYKNPMNWTGWTIRNQESASTHVSWVDNLTLVPEPATLSLVLLGGLAYLRRRR